MAIFLFRINAGGLGACVLPIAPYLKTCFPSLKTALKLALGDEGPAIMKASCDEKLAELEKLAERVYINWLQTAAQV